MAKKTVKLSKEVLGRNGITFHFSEAISVGYTMNFEGPLRPSSEQYLRALGDRGEQIIRELFTIEGINSVTIERYELTIYKAHLFVWDSRNGLERQIVAALRRAFGETILRADETLANSRRSRKKLGITANGESGQSET